MGISDSSFHNGKVSAKWGQLHTDFNFVNRTATNGTITGTATTKQSISGTAGSVTYTGTYDAAFELTPSLAAAAGTYTGVSVSAGTTITLASNGAVVGTGGGCNFTGTAAPRADGNAFNVSLKFGAAPCSLPGQTLSGIAYYDSTDKSLLSVVINPGRTASAIFFGTKP